MENSEALKEYSNIVRRLKNQCTDAGLSDDEFKALYFETLNSIKPPNTVRNSILKRFIKYGGFLILSIIILAVIYNLKTVYSCTACNLQEYIYPGLRLLRKLSIPIISLFPSLTALYHETCLVQNPFFTVTDMDCWPCSSVNNIAQMYDPKPVSGQQSTPFIYETDQNIINMQALKVLYQSNKDLFDKEAPKILTSSGAYVQPDNMFVQYHSGEKDFYIWKLNNMDVAKALRQMIPRPKVVPKFGQSTERFIIVDTSQNSFQMPDTECSFSFLLALSGSRTIDLVPAEECRHQCKSLKVDLKEAYLLWYNWWYWRPVVQSSNGNTTFIAHVGSYC